MRGFRDETRGRVVRRGAEKEGGEGGICAEDGHRDWTAGSRAKLAAGSVDRTRDKFLVRSGNSFSRHVLNAALARCFGV